MVRPCFLLEGRRAVLEELLLPATEGRGLQALLIAELRDRLLVQQMPLQDARLPPIASAVMKDRSRLRHVPIPAPARPTASSILGTGSTPSRPTSRSAAAIACAIM